METLESKENEIAKLKNDMKQLKRSLTRCDLRNVEKYNLQQLKILESNMLNNIKIIERQREKLMEEAKRSTRTTNFSFHNGYVE